jgi:hypothetical protein
MPFAPVVRHIMQPIELPPMDQSINELFPEQLIQPF